jgi:4-amino-4-deoxy-L-arabinose transferase-like glycosyltransferase
MTRWPQAILPRRQTFLIVVALSLFLFGIGNLPWQLDDYDQAKQAFTSFQMVSQNHWLYQNTPHQRIATKPPLVGWISAAIFLTTRSWELAWRLPSLLAALTIAFVLFRLAQSAFAPVAAIVSLCAFTFNLLSPRLATLVRTDAPLALVIFLIGVLIWNKVRKKEAWRPNDRWTVFGLLTAGMLIKGPVVWAFLVPGLIVFQLRRDKTEVSAFSGWWPWIGSLLIFLIWAGGGIWFVPGFYEQVVLREFLGRFGGEVHRAQPLFFYVPHVLHKFAPWSLLMIVLGVIELRRVNWRWGSVRLSPETFWLLCWSFGGLVFMSILPSKRVDRIFPVIPPLCLLLGAQFAALFSASQTKTRVGRWVGAATAFAVLFTGGYVAWKVATGYRQHRDALARFGSEVRKEAIAQHLHYAVVSSPDEGLLPYLRKTEFVLPDQAIADWNSGQIDGVVTSTSDANDLLGQLKPPGTRGLRSAHREQPDTTDYVFITKSAR